MGLHPPRRILSLCAGGGGLDMGLTLAEPQTQTVCWVEWEDYAQRAIVAGQAAGYFEPAPVWDDVFTFEGSHWRGLADTILAGYPCQPFSAAGSRQGEADERHLWPDIARIISEVRPRWVFLENVEGHVSLGLEAVLGDLRGMGFAVAAGLFSAAETGATHKRERVFIVAHADGDGDRTRAQPSVEDEIAFGAGRRRGPHVDDHGDPELADSAGGGCGELGQTAFAGRVGHADGGDIGLADASDGQFSQPGRRPEERDGAGSAGALGRLGDAGGAGSEGRELIPSCDGCAGPGAYGSTAEPGDAWLPIAPPGPGDRDGWAAVIGMAPDLAPSVSLGDVKRACDDAATLVARGRMAEAEAESLVCGMAHGLAERTRALRLYGNGVHPITAAYAWRSLSYALGLWPVDLDGTIAGDGDPDGHVWLGAAE